MIVKTSFEGGLLKIVFEGELDHHAAKKAMTEIENRIDELLPRSCVLDLGRLSFMDSSGIAVILKTKKRMSEIGGGLTVENVKKQPRRVLDASGIARIIKMTISSKES